MQHFATTAITLYLVACILVPLGVVIGLAADDLGRRCLRDREVQRSILWMPLSWPLELWRCIR